MPGPSTDAGKPASFWRCERCNTPNPWTAYLTNCIGCGAPRPSRPAGKTESLKTAEEPLSPPAAVKGGRWLVGASGLYAALVIGIWISIWALSDRWWPATLLLFMPRWALLLPLIALAAAAGWFGRRRLWILHGMTALVVAAPLMGLSLPFERLRAPRPVGPHFRLMTLNQAQGTLDAARLIHLIEQYNVKVICFQEGYCPPEGRPDPILEQYFSKAWYRNKNLTIASRFPITAEFEPLENPDVAPWFWKARVNRARLKLPSGQEFLVADVHMPTMHFAFQRLAQGHLADFQQHITWRGEKMGIVAAALADTHDLPLLVGGDFNMPSDSTLMPALRLAGLHDAFGEAGWGYGYTRPSGIPWAGIDHILGGPEWTFTHCWVGPDVGSDHLPLLAEVVLSKEGAAGDLRPE